MSPRSYGLIKIWKYNMKVGQVKQIILKEIFSQLKAQDSTNKIKDNENALLKYLVNYIIRRKKKRHVYQQRLFTNFSTREYFFKSL